MLELEKLEIGTRTYDLMTDLIKRYPVLDNCRESITRVFLILRQTFTDGNKLLICGNGGSAADAEHFSAELLKGFLKKRPLPQYLKTKVRLSTENDAQWVERLQIALPVYPLNINSALTTAVSNDTGGDLIFAQQVLGYGNRGDCLLAISTSGNSGNVLKAVIIAQALGMSTIGLTGSDGGELKKFCELMIQVPATAVYQVQELHLPVYHTLAAMLEEEIFS